MELKQTRGRRTPLAVVDALDQIGENFAQWRKLLRLSIDDLAEKSRVSRSTIMRLERGEGASLENVLLLARAMGILGEVVASSDPFEHDRGRELLSSLLGDRVRKG